MNYGVHNFIEITQQTKLRVALVVSSQSNQSSSTCQASRARRVERVELCCSTMSTQPKCMGSSRAKWNLGLMGYKIVAMATPVA